MPQDSIFHEDSIYDGVQVTWEEVMLPAGRAWNCLVKRRARGKMWTTVHASRWEGVMLDYMSTMQEQCGTAFMYGQPRDLARAAGSVVRLARRHYKDHQVL